MTHFRRFACLVAVGCVVLLLGAGLPNGPAVAFVEASPEMVPAEDCVFEGLTGCTNPNPQCAAHMFNGCTTPDQNCPYTYWNDDNGDNCGCCWS